MNVRQVLFWDGVRKMGYSGAAVARYLGVSTSCVNRFIYHWKKTGCGIEHSCSMNSLHKRAILCMLGIY